MTFFLNDKPMDLPPRGPDRQPTSFWEGAGAAMQTEWRDSNINWQRERQVNREKVDRAKPLAERVGIAALNERAQQDAEKTGVFAKTVDEFYAIHGDTVASDVVLQAARAKAYLQPDQWADVDLTEEGINKTITERRIVEDRDEAQILAMSPRPMIAGFLGATAGAVIDPVNIAMMPLGGGAGSFMRVLAREALLGAAAEVPSLPARMRTAEELGKADPSVIGTLATGAIGGAALGGLFEGVARGIQYYRGRSALNVPETVDPAFAEAAVNAAEDALVADENPLEAVVQAMRGAPPEAGMLMLDPSMRVTPEPTALAPDPITTEVLPPAEPPPRAPLIPPEALPPRPEAAASPLPATDGLAPPAPKKARTSKVPKKPMDLSAFVAKNGIWKGDDTGELTAMDLQKRPGMLRKEIFKLSGGGQGNNGGGYRIDDLRLKAVTAGYLPEGATINDFLDALANDIGGRKVFTQEDAVAAMDWQDYQKAQGMNPDRTAVDDYVAMEPAPGGLFVSENDLGFLTADDVARQFDAWAETKPSAQVLTPQERAEIIDILQTRGGDAEFLVERALEREADFVDGKEAPADNPAGNPLPEDAIGFGATGPVSGETRGGGAGAEGGTGVAARADGQPAAQAVAPDPRFGTDDPTARLQAVQDSSNAASRKLDSDLDALMADFSDAQKVAVTRAIEQADPMEQVAAKKGAIAAFTSSPKAAILQPAGYEKPAFNRAKKLAETTARGDQDPDVQQFRKTYEDGRLDDMRTNPDLADVVAYGDWLGGLSDAQWQTVAPTFSRRFNPFLNPATIDVVERRADLERALSEGGPTSRAAERTDAGIQTLIDGVAPITPVAKLQAMQGKPLDGRRTTPDSQIGGLFDPGDKARTDLFDDPAGPKARPRHDMETEDMRDVIDRDGDFMVDMMDGKGKRPASSLIAEFQADDDFEDVLNACAKPRVTP